MAVWDVEAAVHAACLWTLGNLLLRGQSGSTRSAISDISTFEVCIWKCISDDKAMRTMLTLHAKEAVV